jgi:hypothetical protein
MQSTQQQSTQASLLNAEIRTKVAKVLSIDEDPSWTIEVSENLCLVSSKKEMMPRYPDLRGCVVDLNHSKVVVPCYGRITSVLTPMVHFDQGQMTVEDMDGNVKTLERNDIRFTYGFEGPVLRLYKNGGKIYCSTNRRLDCSKSRWGTKKTFLEMFKELGGDAILEKAFDPVKPYSSHFLTFIVVHPDMLLCTKQNVESGYLVFLGSQPCFEPSTCPYPEDQVDWISSSTKFDVPFITTDIFEGAIANKVPYCPMPLSVDDVNRHLLVGYGQKHSNDIRTGSGEFVIAYVKNESSFSQEQLYRFVSPAYEHRTKMRNEDPNLLHQFYCLSSEANLSDAEFEMRYPWLEYEDVKKEEAEEGRIMFWNKGKRPIAPDWQKKFRNLWKHFVLSVPLHRQAEVFGYYKQFFLNRETLATWLCSFFGRTVEPLSETSTEEILTPRAKKLMELALAYERKHNPKADLTLSRKNLERNMRYLLTNERGTSLYMLWKNRKQYLRLLEMKEQNKQLVQENESLSQEIQSAKEELERVNKRIENYKACMPSDVCISSDASMSCDGEVCMI